MRKDQIKVGGLYFVKVDDTLLTVRVDDIRVSKSTTNRNLVNLYDVVVPGSGARYTFRSAAKFKSVAPPPAKPELFVTLRNEITGESVIFHIDDKEGMKEFMDEQEASHCPDCGKQLQVGVCPYHLEHGSF